MNLKKTDKIIAILGVVILIVAAIGVVLLMEKDKEGDGNGGDEKEGYTVEWEKTPEQSPVFEEKVMKGSPVEQSYTITAPVDGMITNVEFQISWEDDKTLFGMFGKDTISVTINEEGSESGEPITSGNDTVSFNLNSAPVDEILDEESMDDAEELIQNSYPLSESYSFDYMIHVEKSKIWNLLDKIRDNGEVVTIKISYDVYSYEILEPGEEPDIQDENNDDEPTDEEITTAEVIRNMGSGLGTFN